MNQSNFEQLFEASALVFFEDYQKRDDLLSFIHKKLPLKYGIKNGYLFNKKKEISSENYIFYNQLTCPKLPINVDEKLVIIPANYVYGSLIYLEEVNQLSLENGLQKNEEFRIIFDNQFADSQFDINSLTIWVANDLATFISLNDLEDRLLAETHPPDLVVIINRGLLVNLNENIIQQIFALAQKENPQSYDKGLMNDLISITQKTMQKKYFKLAASAAYRNCFSFYFILLELLKNQDLPKDGLSAEMAGIW